MSWVSSHAPTPMAGDGGRPSIPSLTAAASGLAGRVTARLVALPVPLQPEHGRGPIGRPLPEPGAREAREQALRDHPDAGGPIVKHSVEELFVGG